MRAHSEDANAFFPSLGADRLPATSELLQLDSLCINKDTDHPIIVTWICKKDNLPFQPKHRAERSAALHLLANWLSRRNWLIAGGNYFGLTPTEDWRPGFGLHYIQSPEGEPWPRDWLQLWWCKRIRSWRVKVSLLVHGGPPYIQIPGHRAWTNRVDSWSHPYRRQTWKFTLIQVLFLYTIFDLPLK